MSCSFDPSFEIATNVTYAVFDAITEVCPRTYLRPDPGGSMMPYLFVIILFLAHLPTCFIRVVKWESAQYLSLGLAVFSIAFTVQAYVSTALKPGEILVWMPLTLVLDVGAMMQMVILIIEKHHVEGDDGIRRGGLRALRQAITDMLRGVVDTVLRRWRPEGRVEDGGAQNDPAAPAGQEPPIPLNNLQAPQDDGQHPANVAGPLPVEQQVEQQVEPVEEQPNLLQGNGQLPADAAGRLPVEQARPVIVHKHALRYALVALVSFVLLLMLLVLQIFGLVKAAQGHNQPNITVNWCSPAFRDFALAVTTGNCQKYAVLESSSNGIGCIALPGDQQRDWLRGTIIALSLALASEVFDFCVLICTDSETKRNHVKMQRPWATIFGGGAMLLVLIAFGWFNANRLPKGVTETVWIYRKEASSAKGRVCRGTLNTPGLRGVMIGYMDGLFQSWGCMFNGC